ncbi:GxxExxY protein [Patescibacteria group bacterium]|nr:GxxExxY protein [Patescibacteria group bacterium]
MIRNKDIIFPELSYKISGILFGVRKNLGRYKNEKQYCDAIEEELKKNNIDYEREKILPESFDGEQKGRNKVDFLIDNEIILEIKAKAFVTKEDYFQIRRYLDCLSRKLGILVNMRRYYVSPKRILNSSVSHDSHNN